MSETAEFWAGTFGDDYTERNRVPWAKRLRFWDEVIPPGVDSVLEVGCNAGWNMRCIRNVHREIECVGVDVNEKALLEAASAGFEVHRMGAHDVAQRLGHDRFDLVFTAGVLIHVEPEMLDQVMAAIIDASKRYVLAIEYANEVSIEVPYRGHEGKLWKRPFRLHYERMGLKLLRFGFVGEKEGFDDCAWWLLQKR